MKEKTKREILVRKSIFYVRHKNGKKAKDIPQSTRSDILSMDDHFVDTNKIIYRLNDMFEVAHWLYTTLARFVVIFI